MLKRKVDCSVELVQYNENGQSYLLVLKTFNKELVMQDGTKIDQIMNERDVLKRISSIQYEGIFKEKTSP